MRPTLTWTLLALLLCGTAIGAVLLLYPSEPAPVAPFASPPQATPAAKPSIFCSKKNIHTIRRRPGAGAGLV
ncbi:hypothetical protein, partial [Escherichia coli]|uniref:hypothetical protein n=1 Tax=Escherichia coli TaxID=562 RepID=UPI001BC836D0